MTYSVHVDGKPIKLAVGYADALLVCAKYVPIGVHVIVTDHNKKVIAAWMKGEAVMANGQPIESLAKP